MDIIFTIIICSIFAPILAAIILFGYIIYGFNGLYHENRTLFG